MLFDTVKKKNQAEQEEQAWNQNTPADYASRNKEGMDALTGQIGSGFDGSSLAEAYRQYREQAAGSAQDAADSTRAAAAALAGGYGSSYADSAARQGQSAAMEGVTDTLPGLRARALSEYQNSQNGLVEALSGMANTEALDRSAYGSNLANRNNWKNFLANQSAQARNENDNYWNNLWNTMKTVGSAAATMYDTYKGYAQQQWENEFAKEQWEYNKGRTDKSDALSAYEQAYNLYAQGLPDAANDVLNRYGLNTDVFANYTGAAITRDDQAKVLMQAASLVADGNTEAAANLLKMYGMDADAAGNYDTLTQRALSTALAKAAATKTGSSGYGSSGKSSGKSSGSSGGAKSSGYTTSQLMSMANKFAAMKETNPLYGHYKEVLTDAGWLEPETVTNTGSGGNTVKSGQGTLSRVQIAANAAKGQLAKGSNMQTVYNSLRLQGYSDSEIEQAFNLLE